MFSIGPTAKIKDTHTPMASPAETADHETRGTTEIGSTSASSPGSPNWMATPKPAPSRAPKNPMTADWSR